MPHPEDVLPADVYYSDAVARKYTSSSRIRHVQTQMARRALQILNLRRPSLVLDIGCGSGLSGQVLSSNGTRGRRRPDGESAAPLSEAGHARNGAEDYESAHDDDDDDGSENASGDSADDDDGTGSDGTDSDTGPHVWVGMDVSAAMLAVALERDVEGDLMLADVGQAGVPFRPGTFDGAISISALQWLCTPAPIPDRAGRGRGRDQITRDGGDDDEGISYSDDSTTSTTHTWDGPDCGRDEFAHPLAPVRARLATFFTTLYAALRPAARAVFQLYPRHHSKTKLISDEAVRAGFRAGLLEDHPDSKKRKLYLVLQVGGTDPALGQGPALPQNGDITAAVSGLDNVEVCDRRKVQQSNSRDGGRPASAGKKATKGSRQWILHKKDQMEKKGRVVKHGSKYTGRKRRPVF